MKDWLKVVLVVSVVLALTIGISSAAQNVAITEPMKVTSGPAANVWNNTEVNLFVRGTDGALWWENSTGTWVSLGGIIYPGTSPAVTSLAANRTDIFVKGMSGSLWHKFVGRGGVSDWENLGGWVNGTSTAVVTPNGNMTVYVMGGNGGMWSKQYQSLPPGTGWGDWVSLGGIYPSSPGFFQSG